MAQAAKVIPGQQTSVQSSTGSTVTVALKAPHGLKLRLFEFKETEVAVLGGGLKSQKEAFPIDGEVVLNGTSMKKEDAPHCLIIDGFALTPNVNKEFFDKWMTQNKDHHIVKNGLIFACASQHDAQDQANARVALKSGLEPLDPESLPRGLQKFDGKSAA